jgi:ABC-type glycerol-3-phosphate transport system permease component
MFGSSKQHLKKRPFSVFFLILFVLLVIYAIGLLAPIVWAFFTSFKSQTEYEFMENVIHWPTQWTFSNYIEAYKKFYVRVYDAQGNPLMDYYMPGLFMNSFLYAIGCAIAGTLTPCLVAYVTARFKYKLSRVIYGLVIVTMALPIIGSLPSEIAMSKSLGLFDTFVGLWIMKANILGIYFLVFYAQFASIPKDYVEAAKIDGASNTRILWQIMMPLIRGTFWTIFLLNFIVFWNDYQVPMIYLPSHPVAAYGIFEFQQSLELNYVPAKLAGIFIMTLPILILFLIFNRKIMVNVTTGGIKG